jgi:hypothetical protein
MQIRVPCFNVLVFFSSAFYPNYKILLGALKWSCKTFDPKPCLTRLNILMKLLHKELTILNLRILIHTSPTLKWNCEIGNPARKSMRRRFTGPISALQMESNSTLAYRLAVSKCQKNHPSTRFNSRSASDYNEMCKVKLK